MTVKELIDKLQKLEHQDWDVSILGCDIEEIEQYHNDWGSEEFYDVELS